MFYTRLLSLLTTFLFLQPSTIFAQRKEIIVSNSTELNSAILTAKPNDFIILKDGVWHNTEINFKAKANAANPITLKSQTAGKVIFSGSSKITITQPHLIVNGFPI
jgi:poly(beta-D-mannuronate) lyase